MVYIDSLACLLALVHYHSQLLSCNGLFDWIVTVVVVVVVVVAAVAAAVDHRLGILNSESFFSNVRLSFLSCRPRFAVFTR